MPNPGLRPCGHVGKLEPGLTSRKRLAHVSCLKHGGGDVVRKSRPPIPVNLIAGPLGVGKTTTINHLLSERPEGENWAILVNEYGLVGLDAALMASDDPRKREGVHVREIAGGCICCSAGTMFDVSLVLLLQRRPDRLLIEPTGLAALSGILDTLDRPGIREAVDVRSILCLLDPSRIEKAMEREEVRDQVQAADVVLASRADLATSEDLDGFDDWSSGLFPPKRFVGPVERGRIPLELLDLVSNRQTQVPRAGHRHGTDHHPHAHNHADEAAGHGEPARVFECDAKQPIVQHVHRSKEMSTLGWILWKGIVFDAERTSAWLYGLSDLPGTRRIKAVLRTNAGWWAFNLTDGVEDVQPSGYRRDSRLELIIEGEDVADPTALERALLTCIERREEGAVPS
ncbi:MAG: GTP-binding protein [Myxococcota bacterium]